MNSGHLSVSEFASIVASLGANKILFKVPAANDNSKNQMVRVFDVLQILPIGSIESDPNGNDRLKARVVFSWIVDESRTVPAPNAQLILCPQYPEVRLSGFLSGPHATVVNERGEVPCVRFPGRP